MTRTIPLLILALGVLQSCASASLDSKLDEKLALQPEVKRSNLEAKADSLSKSASGLSDSQKEKLAALRAEVRAKLADINTKSLKVRSILLKEMLASKTNPAEISAAKNRIRSLSRDRLDTIFGAVDSANKIVGRSDLIRQEREMQILEREFDQL